LRTNDLTQVAENYATDFIKQLQLDSEVEQKCEWSCLLWSRDYWVQRARKAERELQQTKEYLANSARSDNLEILSSNSQFLNTVAQVYANLFDREGKACRTKSFATCPYLDQREDLLYRGSLARVFVTILHKAVSYAMLERHPLDSGLIDEEYENVYGIDLTNFRDLERSMTDGRFEALFEATVKRSRQLAGLPSPKG